MIKYTDECVGCPKELSCLGSSCPNKNVPHMICDKCNEEFDTLYDVDGEELCEDCALSLFNKITL